VGVLTRGGVRAIDELPDTVYQRIAEGEMLNFKALPEADTDPPDERTDDFQIALEAARLEDQERGVVPPSARKSPRLRTRPNARSGAWASYPIPEPRSRGAGLCWHHVRSSMPARSTLAFAESLLGVLPGDAPGLRTYLLHEEVVTRLAGLATLVDRLDAALATRSAARERVISLSDASLDFHGRESS
jgi:hypothetical protein